MYDENAYCKKCGRLIHFIRTRNGKLMPVDGFSLQVVPGKEGALYINADGEMIRGKPIGMKGPSTVTAWQSHFATCPVLNRDRAKKGETWREKQSRLAHERLEKEIAEAEAKAARRAERERKEAAERELQDAQTSLFHH